MARNYEVALALYLVFVVVLSIGPVWVSAQTHHVVGDDAGWGPHLNLSSWLSGRVFRVGDKIWFSLSAPDENIIELGSLDEFVSCNLTNPIRMYTDATSHVTLDKQGARYFTSGNVEHCKNGLRMHVPVEPPPFGPYEPIEPPPAFQPPEPEPFEPPPSFQPPEPYKPEPEPFKPTPPSYGPPEPYPPSIMPPPPPPSPRRPSASASLKGLSLLLFSGLSLCFMSF